MIVKKSASSVDQPELYITSSRVCVTWSVSQAHVWTIGLLRKWMQGRGSKAQTYTFSGRASAKAWFTTWHTCYKRCLWRFQVPIGCHCHSGQQQHIRQGIDVNDIMRDINGFKAMVVPRCDSSGLMLAWTGLWQCLFVMHPTVMELGCIFYSWGNLVIVEIELHVGLCQLKVLPVVQISALFAWEVII